MLLFLREMNQILVFMCFCDELHFIFVFHISSIKCMPSGQVLCHPTLPEQWAAQAFYSLNTLKAPVCENYSHLVEY